MFAMLHFIMFIVYGLFILLGLYCLFIFMKLAHRGIEALDIYINEKKNGRF